MVSDLNLNDYININIRRKVLQDLWALITNYPIEKRDKTWKDCRDHIQTLLSHLTPAVTEEELEYLSEQFHSTSSFIEDRISSEILVKLRNQLFPNNGESKTYEV